jgi:hypothetical protein
MLVATGIILPLGYSISNNPFGLTAGLAAAGGCLLAAYLALGICDRFRRPEHVLAFVLVGMAIRMGIPLVSALVVVFLGRPLADAGYFYYLMVFYPVMLAAETALALPRGRIDDSPSTPSRGDSG